MEIKLSLEEKYSTHKNYAEIIKNLDEVIDFTQQILSQRNIPFSSVEKLAEVKYGTRTWLEANGYKSKNKDLEMELCIEEYKKHLKKNT